MLAPQVLKGLINGNAFAAIPLSISAFEGRLRLLVQLVDGNAFQRLQRNADQIICGGVFSFPHAIFQELLRPRTEGDVHAGIVSFR